MSITGNSDNIFVNNANLKIAKAGKGLIFADGSVLYTANVFNTQNLLSNIYQFTNTQTAFVINEVTANTGFAGNTAPTDAISVSSNLFISYTGNLTTYGQITTNTNITTTNINTYGNLFVNSIATDLSKTSNVITYDPITGELFDSGGEGGGGGGGSNVEAGTAGQIAYYSTSTTVKGDGALTFDENNSNVDVTGNVNVSGNTHSNLVTSIVYFGSSPATPFTGGLTLSNVVDKGNTTSNTVQFTNTGTSLVTSGSVGIGTNTPSANLHVVGNTFVANNITLGDDINIRSTKVNAVINIGRDAGVTNQGDDCMAFGDNAGNSNQGLRGIAFGNNAGAIGQGDYALAFGNAAGNTGQGGRGVAIGTRAGNTNQGSYSVAIGRSAGESNQGVHSIAIGNLSNALDNSIVLNATGSELHPSTTDGFFVKPIKTDTSKTSNVITYDSTSGELFDSGGAVYCSFRGSGNQTLGASYSVITLSDELENSDSTTDFTLASGVITVKKAGVYVIAFNISTTLTSGTTRSDSSAYLDINSSVMPGTKVYMYNRTVGVGEDSGSVTIVKTLTANDAISIYARLDDGTGPVDCIRPDTQISLYRIA